MCERRSAFRNFFETYYCGIIIIFFELHSLHCNKRDGLDVSRLQQRVGGSKKKTTKSKSESFKSENNPSAKNFFSAVVTIAFVDDLNPIFALSIFLSLLLHLHDTS